MDILNDNVIIYLRKNLIPAIIIHNITKKSNTLVKLDEIGELKPRLNKVKIIIFLNP